jgi:hypothetical protein
MVYNLGYLTTNKYFSHKPKNTFFVVKSLENRHFEVLY